MDRNIGGVNFHFDSCDVSFSDGSYDFVSFSATKENLTTARDFFDSLLKGVNMDGVCELCERPILKSEASCIHDGELCHIDCAANDMDEQGFFDERDND